MALGAGLSYAVANTFSGELGKDGPKNLIYQWPGLLAVAIIYYFVKFILYKKNGTPVISKSIFLTPERRVRWKAIFLILLHVAAS